MVGLEDADGGAVGGARAAQDGVTAGRLDGVDDGRGRGRAFYCQELVGEVGGDGGDAGELVEGGGDGVDAGLAVHGDCEEGL